MPEGPLGMPRFTDLGPFVSSNREVYVYGGSPRTVGVGWKGYDFIKSSVNIRQKEDATLIDVIAESVEGGSVGALGVIVDNDLTNLFHLEVPEDKRRMGVGTFYMDIFKGIAKWNGRSRVIGSVGGGEQTKQFFIDNGINSSDARVEDGEAKFDTNLRAISFGRVNFHTGGRR